MLTIHQQLLEEKSEQIHKSTQTLIADIDNVVTDNEKETLHYVHYLIEIASFYDKYYDIARAKESLEKVKQISGFGLGIIPIIILKLFTFVGERRASILRDYNYIHCGKKARIIT